MVKPAYESPLAPMEMEGKIYSPVLKNSRSENWIRTHGCLEIYPCPFTDVHGSQGMPPAHFKHQVNSGMPTKSFSAYLSLQYTASDTRTFHPSSLT
jgi:hypothetical protein